MQISPTAFKTYTKEIEGQLRAGNAGEHAYRPALKALLESLEPQLDIKATNEPLRVACGAPDLAVTRNASREPQTVGYVETKDLDVDLATVESSEQLQRYRRGLENLVLTDYLEFRWYVDGSLRRTARLGTLNRVKQHIIRDRSSADDLHDLLAGFLSHRPPPISRAKELAERLARPTHMIRNTIDTAFAQGRVSDVLRDLHRAFAQVLVPDLPVDDFADMFAQTLTYGLFAARVNHDPAWGKFQRLGAANEIPRTNPFLRKLFGQITGLTLDDEPFVGFVGDLVQMLAESDMESILKDFGRESAREDPVVHFYETFLTAYDPELREERGVYFTPEPVVSYIVRSVDYLLRERFGLPEGLADQTPTTYDGATYTDTPDRKNKGNGGSQQAPKVLILDPATGTGTFLYKVIGLIRENFMQSGNAGLWSSYVKEQLLPRLFGFELLMAPYAVAHLKLGMQLAGLDLPQEARPDWRYDFESAERLNIFLTNTLEEGLKQSELTLGRFISDEANAAAKIKREMPIMVVLGNPPYRTHSANRSRDGSGDKTWIGRLIDDYYEVDGQSLGEHNPKTLQDDYVKFIRFGQWRIERSGSGILAYITNHGYLDNPTFRGMRQQLMRTFTDIYVVDLHGSVRKGERAFSGARDGNVFNIQQGVAIGIFVKEAQRAGPARVHHAQLWGDRQGKLSWLASHDVATTNWSDVRGQPESYLFTPQTGSFREEYQHGWKVTDVMAVNSTGIQTHRDRFVFDFDYKALELRIADFLDPANSDEDVRNRYFDIKASGSRPPGDTNDWQLAERRKALQKDPQWRKTLVQCLYSAFDVRWLFYHRNAIDRGRWELMENMLERPNKGIITTRQQSQHGQLWSLIGISNCMIERCSISNKTKEGNYLFPLYLYPPREDVPNKQTELRNLSPWPEGLQGRRPNLAPAFVKDIEQRLGWTFVPDGRGNLGQVASIANGNGKMGAATFGPEDILHYIYAVLHAPSYRSRYAEFLKADFPRVPLTSYSHLFAALARLGANLVGLHTFDDSQAPELKNLTTSYPIRGTDEVASSHPRYLAPGEPDPLSGTPLIEGRVYINRGNTGKSVSGQYFEGVPPEVWEFHIGGYQVCEKWLKDRRGRTLSNADLNHYRRIIVALQETIRTMEAIDDAIPGWPLPNDE